VGKLGTGSSQWGNLELDVTNQTLLAGNNLIIPGRVCLVTSRLGTGKTITFFYSVQAGKGLNGSCQQEKMELDPTSGKRLLDLASGKTWNRSLPAELDPAKEDNLEMVLPVGELGTRVCQRKKMELDPASGKTWNWILPAVKMELDPATGKIWNWILSRENLELEDSASEKT
jgi:hypothetical protein